MHHQAEIDRERLELRGALRTYQKITELAPDDVKAKRETIDVYFRLNDSIHAIQELDRLLQIYAKQRRADLILQTLESMSQDYPDDLGLCSRLGTVYQQMGRAAEAIKQLEHLRQLQYDGGKHEEARKTITRILSLNPPNAAYYQQLLQQLGG